MKSLTINRPIKIRCEFCNNAFSSLENLEVHKKVEHSEKLKKPSGWKCSVNFCGAQFLNRKSLNLHTLKIHPNGIKPKPTIASLDKLKSLKNVEIQKNLAAKVSQNSAKDENVATPEDPNEALKRKLDPKEYKLVQELLKKARMMEKEQKDANQQSKPGLKINALKMNRENIQKLPNTPKTRPEIGKPIQKFLNLPKIHPQNGKNTDVFKPEQTKRKIYPKEVKLIQELLKEARKVEKVPKDTDTQLIPGLKVNALTVNSEIVQKLPSQLESRKPIKKLLNQPKTQPEIGKNNQKLANVPKVFPGEEKIVKITYPSTQKPTNVMKIGPKSQKLLLKNQKINPRPQKSNSEDRVKLIPETPKSNSESLKIHPSRIKMIPETPKSNSEALRLHPSRLKLIPETPKSSQPKKNHPKSLKVEINGQEIVVSRDAKITCVICDKNFEDSHQLDQHLINAHGSKNKIEVKKDIFKCDLCKMTFNDFLALQSHSLHTKIHGKPNPLKCQICLKTFTKIDQRKIHIIQIHKRGQKNTKSEVCVPKLLKKESNKNDSSTTKPIVIDLADSSESEYAKKSPIKHKSKSKSPILNEKESDDSDSQSSSKSDSEYNPEDSPSSMSENHSQSSPPKSKVIKIENKPQKVPKADIHLQSNIKGKVNSKSLKAIITDTEQVMIPKSEIKSESLPQCLIDSVLICGFCNKTFAEKFTFNDHKCGESSPSSATPAGVICEFCNIIFTSEGDLEIHISENHLGPLVTKEEPTNLNCHMCNITFDDFWTKKFHMQAFHEGKSHKCEPCNQYFYSMKLLNDHLKNHQEVCTFCHKVFDNTWTLKFHIQALHSTKNHRCDKCDKAFDSEITLKNHIICHSYECMKCGQHFEGSWSLSFHVQALHSDPQAGKIQDLVKNNKCHKCNKTFKNEKFLEKHIIQHIQAVYSDITDRNPNANGENPKCEFCGNVFMSIPELAHHIADDHCEPYEHKCIFCWKYLSLTNEFKSRAGLKSHIRNLHLKINAKLNDVKVNEVNLVKKLVEPIKPTEESEIEPNIAKIGPKSTKMDSIDTKRLVCGICKNKFTNDAKLIAHMNDFHKIKMAVMNTIPIPDISMVTEDGKFECDICNKHFQNKHYLDKHTKEDHSDRVQCQFCDRVFTSVANMKQHKNWVHNEKNRQITDENAKVKDKPDLTETEKILQEYGVQLNPIVQDPNKDKPISMEIDKDIFEDTQSQQEFDTSQNMVGYTCSTCNESFEGETQWQKHVQDVHSSPKNNETINQIDDINSNEPIEMVTAFQNSSTFVEEPLENPVDKEKGNSSQSHGMMKEPECSQTESVTVFENTPPIVAEQKYEECGVCKKTFDNKINLENHIRDDHNAIMAPSPKDSPKSAMLRREIPCNFCD